MNLARALLTHTIAAFLGSLTVSLAADPDTSIQTVKGVLAGTVLCLFWLGARWADGDAVRTHPRHRMTP